MKSTDKTGLITIGYGVMKTVSATMQTISNRRAIKKAADEVVKKLK